MFDKRWKHCSSSIFLSLFLSISYLREDTQCSVAWVTWTKQNAYHKSTLLLSCNLSAHCQNSLPLPSLQGSDYIRAVAVFTHLEDTVCITLGHTVDGCSALSHLGPRKTAAANAPLPRGRVQGLCVKSSTVKDLCFFRSCSRGGLRPPDLKLMTLSSQDFPRLLC